MRKIFTFLTLAIFTLQSFAQVPNSGFESWASGSPVSWDTPNGDLYGMITVVNEETSAPYAGSKSALLETKNLTLGFPFNINQDVPGLMTLGQFTVNMSAGSGDVTGGIPWTSRSRVMKFAYKSQTAGTDTFTIAAILFKSGDTVAIGLLRRNETVLSWTEDSVVFKYEDSTLNVNLVDDYPDSMNIWFMSSDTAVSNITVGSKLWIDAVSVEGNVPLLVSIKENQIEGYVGIYPNPAENNITIDFPSKEDATVSIFNTIGQTLYKTKINTIKQDIDVSSFPKGLYFIEITTDINKITKKIVIK